MASRESYIEALRSVIGAPYIWGGSNPVTGLDCSGTVLYCLFKSGLDLHDMTARQLAQMFEHKRVGLGEVKPGCLFFYGRPAHHVMSCLSVWPNGKFVLAGARGGNEKTVNPDVAYNQGAAVDVVFGDYWRSELSLIVDPFKEDA